MGGGQEQVQQNPVFGPRSSLAELLVANDLELVKLLILKGGLFDSNSILEQLLTLTVLYGKATRLITWAAYDEIDTTKSEGTLFRGTSHATRLISHFFMQPIGQEYLKQIVLPLLSTMTSSTGSFEIDPEKLENPQSADDNLARLLSAVQSFLDSVIESRKKFPVAFSEVLSLIQQHTKEKFSKAEHSVIGGFVFLRFLCPAMVTPEKYNIVNVPVTKEVRRGLVLVSKILQNLANGVEFGMKEGYMVKLNPFVEKNMQSVANFFDIIASLNLLDPKEAHKSRSDTVGSPPLSSSPSKLSSSPTLQKSVSMFSGPAAAANAKAAETLAAIEVHLQQNRASVAQGMPEMLQDKLTQVLDGLAKKEPAKKEDPPKPTAKVSAMEGRKRSSSFKATLGFTPKPESPVKKEEPTASRPSSSSTSSASKTATLDSKRVRSASVKGTPSFVQSLRIGLDPKKKDARQQQQDDLSKYEIEHLRERLNIERKEKDEYKKNLSEVTKERDFWKQVFDAAVLEGDDIKTKLEQTMAMITKRRDTSVIKQEARQELQAMYDAEQSARKAAEAANQDLRDQLLQVQSMPNLGTNNNLAEKEPEPQAPAEAPAPHVAEDPAPEAPAPEPTQAPEPAPVSVPAPVAKINDSEVIEQLQKKLWDAENELRELRSQLAERKHSSSGADSAPSTSAANSTGSPTPAELTVIIPSDSTTTIPATPTEADTILVIPSSPIITRATSTTTDATPDSDSSPPISPSSSSLTLTPSQRISRHKKSKSTHTLPKPMLGSPTMLDARPRQNSVNRKSSGSLSPITIPDAEGGVGDAPRSPRSRDNSLKKSISTDGLDKAYDNDDDISKKRSSVDISDETTRMRKLESWQKEYSIKDKLKFFEAKSAQQR